MVAWVSVRINKTLGWTIIPINFSNNVAVCVSPLDYHYTSHLIIVSLRPWLSLLDSWLILVSPYLLQKLSKIAKRIVIFFLLMMINPLLRMIVYILIFSMGICAYLMMLSHQASWKFSSTLFTLLLPMLAS